MKILVEVTCGYPLPTFEAYCGGEHRYKLETARLLALMGHSVVVAFEPYNTEWQAYGVRGVNWADAVKDDYDLYISSEGFMIEHLTNVPISKKYAFCLGTPSVVKPQDTKRIIGYNEGGIVWAEENRYTASYLPFPMRNLDERPERNRRVILASASEMFIEIGAHFALDVYDEIRRDNYFGDDYSDYDLELHLYYSSLWREGYRGHLARGGNGENSVEDQKEYMLMWDNWIDNPPTGVTFFDTVNYDVYMKVLASSGYFMGYRREAPNPPVLAASMFYGTPTISFDGAIHFTQKGYISIPKQFSDQTAIQLFKETIMALNSNQDDWEVMSHLAKTAAYPIFGETACSERWNQILERDFQ